MANLIMPRGFITTADWKTFDATPPASDNDIVKSEGDVEIEELYELFVHRKVSTSSWEFRSKVIKCVKRLLGSNFAHWCYVQTVINSSIYGLNFQFIQDTLQFIRTGTRDASVQSWLDLLAEFPEKSAGVANIERYKSLGISGDEVKSLDDYISLWCSHEEGFVDMLCAVRVLHGSAKTPVVKPTLNLI